MSSPSASTARLDLDEGIRTDLDPGPLSKTPRLTPNKYRTPLRRRLLPTDGSSKTPAAGFKTLTSSYNNPPSSDGESANSHAPVADDYEWTSGDFEVLSADNVRFLVPSCFVLASR